MNNPRGKILNIARGARKRKEKKERTKRNHHKKNHNPRVLITHVQYDLRSLSRWGLRESKSDRKVRDWLGRNLRTLDSEGGPKIGTETCSGENLLVVIGVYTHTHTHTVVLAATSLVRVLDRTDVCACEWGTHLPRNFSSRDVSPSFHSASKWLSALRTILTVGLYDRFDPSTLDPLQHRCLWPTSPLFNSAEGERRSPSKERVNRVNDRR